MIPKYTDREPRRRRNEEQTALWLVIICFSVLAMFFAWEIDQADGISKEASNPPLSDCDSGRGEP